MRNKCSARLLILQNGGLAFAAFGLLISAAAAAPLQIGDDLRGQAISQRFLTSGASIVTTVDDRVCVVSRRIDIEASVYQATDGILVPFDQIRRSIAASVQAIAGPAGDAQPAPVGFRIQLKFSPAPGTPIMLTLNGQSHDLQNRLEPSTDSLWIDAELALALQAAFSAGDRLVLQSTSGDTRHLVTDHLEPPDLAALSACQSELDQIAPPAAALPLTNQVRVSFQADPATTPLATLPELRTCGMTDQPGELHLARLDSVTGFFAQTDKVFVSFDDAGEVAQIYIPGILDGDFRQGKQQIRLSRAADSNLPSTSNAVKGCLGAAVMTACNYRLSDGQHLIETCAGSDLQQVASQTETVGPDSLLNPGFIPANFIPGTSGTPDKTVVGGFTEVPETPGGGGTNPPPPSPVPLPAPVLLLLGALTGLYGLRRRRAFIPE